MKKLVAGLIAGAVVFLGLIIYVAVGLTHVGVGKIGLEKHMDGKVTIVPQGIHWTGWGVAVQKYPVYTQALIVKQWEVGTGDQQELPVDTNLTWKIGTKNATALYQSVGGKDIGYVSSKIVEPTMKNVVNQVTHTDSWNNLKGSSQKKITEQIQSQLKEELGKYGIEVGTFGFTKVGSPKGMASSQQQLAASELNIKKAKQEQDKAKIENDTKILNAQAAAKAALIKAQGEAKANQVLAKSVTKELTEYQKVQKWNGKSPTTVVGGETSTSVMVK